MKGLLRKIALSDHPAARTIRAARRTYQNLSVPAPLIIVRPILWLVLLVRDLYYFVARVFFAEPLFKAYCAKVGRNVHTDVFLHWVVGRGEIILGDGVKLWGKSSFMFGTRFVDRPRLVIGDHTSIGHGSTITVAKEVWIGRHCHIAAGTRIFDSSGHPTDPTKRRAHMPPDDADIKPVVIGDNVWIGQDCIIMPGVTIGDNSVVATRSVVSSNVPANALVAGYPARRIGTLEPAPPLPPATTVPPPQYSTAAPLQETA